MICFIGLIWSYLLYRIKIRMTQLSQEHFENEDNENDDEITKNLNPKGKRKNM